MKCIQVLSDSRSCKAFAQKGSSLCFRHDPEQKNNALLASQKGGANRQIKGVYGEIERLDTPEDAKKFLSKVINAVWAEGMPVQAGSSLGFLTRCWLDAYEASDANKRLSEIEKKLYKLF